MTTPDGCPFHDLAKTDPAKPVECFDEEGRYLGPASAELACAGWHTGAWMVRVCASLLDVVERRYGY